MRNGNLIAIAVACAIAAGMYFMLQSTDAGTEMATVDGTFGYRERIMPPPDAVARVTLLDVSRADAASTTLASESFALEGKAPPYDYSLTVDPNGLDERMRYVVRAEIRDGADKLLWTTDTNYPIDPTLAEQTLDPIWLVMVNSTP